MSDNGEIFLSWVIALAGLVELDGECAVFDEIGVYALGLSGIQYRLGNKASAYAVGKLAYPYLQDIR